MVTVALAAAPLLAAPAQSTLHSRALLRETLGEHFNLMWDASQFDSAPRVRSTLFTTRYLMISGCVFCSPSAKVISSADGLSASRNASS